MDEIQVKPAAMNQRFIAYVLDFAPFALALLALMYATGRSSALAEQLGGVRLPALFLAAYVAYQTAGNMAGGTPGKKLMGLYVVRRSDGEKPGLLRALLRAFAHLISYPFFNFGFGVALLHPESRALHDMLTGTVVVEPQAKSGAESKALFLGAVVLLLGLQAALLFNWVFKPNSADLAAVERARAAMLVMAEIEEAYKASHGGVYTGDIGELGKASGDVKTFRTAVTDLFIGESFRAQAGNKGYSISAQARDRRKTRLTVEGPPPVVR